ncbi:MAG: DUF502 domain-containing protein [Candidatus Omnitrophica bacterium]|nr:DUF502 domain-containing protein [Candidatus Omnitrophota bacterium]
MESQEKKQVKLTSRLRNYFFAGLLITLPVFLSLYILYILFGFVDGILGKFINIYVQERWGFYIPGLGLFLFLLIIIFVGFTGTLLAGKGLHRFFDKSISRFPLLNIIYPSLKQVVSILFSKENLAFKKAVLIEYPFKGNWTLAFITNKGFEEAQKKTGQDLLNVIVPIAPNPTSGIIVFVPRKDVIMLDISIQDAMKLIISVGVLNPSGSLEPPAKEP